MWALLSLQASMLHKHSYPDPLVTFCIHLQNCSIFMLLQETYNVDCSVSCTCTGTVHPDVVGCVYYVYSRYNVCVFYIIGDRLSDDDVDQLFQGQEDPQGNVSYEGNVQVFVV